jgi:hypothetical protein
VGPAIYKDVGRIFFGVVVARSCLSPFVISPNFNYNAGGVKSTNHNFGGRRSTNYIVGGW